LIRNSFAVGMNEVTGWLPHDAIKTNGPRRKRSRGGKKEPYYSQLTQSFTPQEIVRGPDAHASTTCSKSCALLLLFTTLVCS
jgi:hypothetical protein